MSWLRFASDWRGGLLQRWPWLPWLGLMIVALLFFLIGAYERDWWILHKAPHIYRPTPPPATSSEELFGR